MEPTTNNLGGAKYNPDEWTVIPVRKTTRAALKQAKDRRTYDEFILAMLGKWIGE